MTNAAYVIDALRVPRLKVSKGGNAYQSLRPVDLLKPLFTALVERHQFDSAAIEDVLLGCNTQINGQGANIAKTAALYAGLGDGVSGATINRFCCSGQDAINMAAAKLMSGMEHLLIAGGVEQISQVPMFTDKGDWFSEPSVMKQTRFMHMGLSAELIAAMQKISKEQLNEYSLLSHQRAASAVAEGYFSNSIVSADDKNDDAIRASLNVEQLSALPPAFSSELEQVKPMFEKAGIPIPVAQHTVANAPALVDGASLVLMASKPACEQHGLTPRARVTHYSNASDDPVIMLTGHIQATEKLLKASKLKASDIDLWEVNESFAASVINYQQHFGINDDDLNVNGGAIAMGHPLGATGGILLGMLLDEMERRDVRRGVFAIPGGAGVGTATLVER